jgi:hypothetical protein
MGMTTRLLALALCTALAACGGKKEDDKKKEEPVVPPTGPKMAGEPGMGGGLAGLFGGGIAGGAARQKAAPTKGLFGGGLNLGALGDMAKKDAPAAEAPGGAPAPPAPPPAAEPGKPAADGGPSCADVARHIGEVAKDELGDDPSMAAEMLGVLTQMCEQMAWPVDGRRCLMQAKDEMAFDRCGELIPGAAGGDGDLGGDGDIDDMPMPVADQPLPSGNAECDAMAVNLVGVILAGQMAQLPAEQRQMMDGMKFTIQNEIAKVCAVGNWPKEAVQCLAGAKSEADAEGCIGKYNLQP